VSRPCFPRLRWAAALWLALYVPAYALAYGFANFLFLCNLAAILGAVLVGAAWTADLAARLVTGSHLIGGTEYMWDPQWPLLTRLLSLYHVALPVVLVLGLRRIGYDRRGWLLQSALALAVVALGRLFPPAVNINYAYVEPLFKRTWGGPVTHVAAVAGFLSLVAYSLGHLLLTRLCPAAGAGEPPK